MCVASEIIAVTVVVILSGGIPTTVRVASDTVGAHTLLPTTAGVTVVAELTELGVKAAATVKKTLSTGLKKIDQYRDSSNSVLCYRETLVLVRQA